MNTGKLIVLTTCETDAQAASIARTLVEERLAACVNIIPRVESVYRWQGEVVSSREKLLIVKSTAALYPQLQQRLREIHPYELPEIVAVSVANGLPEYLTWIETVTSE